MTFAMAREDRFPPPWKWTVKVTILFRAHRNLPDAFVSFLPFGSVAPTRRTERKDRNFFTSAENSNCIFFALVLLLYKSAKLDSFLISLQDPSLFKNYQIMRKPKKKAINAIHIYFTFCNRRFLSVFMYKKFFIKPLYVLFIGCLKSIFSSIKVLKDNWFSQEIYN